MLIKGLPKIKRIRKLAIPGKIDKDQYRKLQNCNSNVEIDDQPGSFLIENGFAEAVKANRKVVRSDG